MSIFLELAFLFFIGSLTGWGLEVLYRKFISDSNPERKWINPGFLAGPYLPLYGFSLCALFLLAHIKISFIEREWLSKIILFVVMALVVTGIEYIAGIIFIKRMKIKLWDYENEWGNIKGIICPKYSFFWAVLSAIYYFLIHPNILKSLSWLASNLSFSFFVGFFYGVFVLDCCYSLNLMTRIRKFAKENEIIVRYEALKESIRVKNEERKETRRFIFAFRSENATFAENLTNYLEKEQERFGKLKEKYETVRENIREEYESVMENVKENIQMSIQENNRKIQKKKKHNNKRKHRKKGKRTRR